MPYVLRLPLRITAADVQQLVYRIVRQLRQAVYAAVDKLVRSAGAVYCIWSTWGYYVGVVSSRFNEYHRLRRLSYRLGIG